MELDLLFISAVKASRSLALLEAEKINEILIDVADEAMKEVAFLLQENEKDLALMNRKDPKYDRLKLTEKRICDIAADMRTVASLKSPLNEVILESVLSNGLLLRKVRVPIGVIGVIYEARPNVTFDVFSLCLKTGNVAVLKGGSDAENSNQAIVSILHRVLKRHNVDPLVAVLLPAERTATEALLNARGYVDVIIPRGSQQLIDYVRMNSRIPVIETGAGIVHAFFDMSGDIAKGKAIINNAKTRRVSVCNALDCLIIHKERLADLPELIELLRTSDVRVYADHEAYGALKGYYPEALLEEASIEHYGTEFLDYKIAIKTVEGLDEALEHINQYGSKHSEAIISEDERNIEKFLNAVDAAAVYANTSTAFTDGAQFGLGAEIGISTQKLHARGPMGLEELTSYKWIVKGEGQIREN